jgi:hypothetical protein
MKWNIHRPGHCLWSLATRNRWLVPKPVASLLERNDLGLNHGEIDRCGFAAQILRENIYIACSQAAARSGSVAGHRLNDWRAAIHDVGTKVFCSIKSSGYEIDYVGGGVYESAYSSSASKDDSQFIDDAGLAPALAYRQALLWLGLVGVIASVYGVIIGLLFGHERTALLYGLPALISSLLVFGLGLYLVLAALTGRRQADADVSTNTYSR